MLTRLIKMLEPFILVVVPVTLGLCAYLRVTQSALLTALVAFAACGLFFLHYEQGKPKPHEFMPIIVMSALAAAGRILFAAIPSFKPTTALCVIAGSSFGRQAGFLTGALAALVSNFFFGQGPWTPWQMYAWGMTGYLAGCLAQTNVGKKRAIMVSYSVLAALFFCFIMDSWTLVGFVNPITFASALSLYTLGLPQAFIHATSTLAFMIPLYLPWSKKLERIKTKYGL